MYDFIRIMILYGMKRLIIILKMLSVILRYVSIFLFNYVSSKFNLKYVDNSGVTKINIFDELVI